MTGMRGSAGVLKKDAGRAYQHTATSVRVDDVVDRDVCLLKADVEGYEPQVIKGGARVFKDMPPHSILTGESPYSLGVPLPWGLHRPAPLDRKKSLRKST